MGPSWRFVVSRAGYQLSVNDWPASLRPRPHQQQCRIAKFDFVEATFDFVATNGNNVERFYCKISSFRQSRNKLNMFNLFRLCRKDEISFDIVAETFVLVERPSALKLTHILSILYRLIKRGQNRRRRRQTTENRHHSAKSTGPLGGPVIRVCVQGHRAQCWRCSLLLQTE